MLADCVKKEPVRPAEWRLRRALWLLPGLAVILFSGCRSASYYTQAVHGQYQIWSKQRCINSLVSDPETSPELRARLERVIEIRAFAEEQLGLPATRHYLRYADLERRFAVWNVYAAPELSLESKTWWYPVVGSLSYRGYFSEDRARRTAARLEQRGYDVFVGGVRAYSTLGWFADPVLNTFVHNTDADLAELIFHELAHARVFIRGDTDFNEAFATAVADEGLRRWMEAINDPEAYAEYRLAARRQQQFVDLVLQARDRLEAVYGNGNPPRQAEAIAGVRRGKQEIFAQLRAHYEQLKAEWGGYSGYDHWFSYSLNNAKLNTVSTYQQLVPAFRALMHKHDGDLEGFYATVEQLGKLPRDDRDQQIAAWRKAAEVLLVKD